MNLLAVNDLLKHQGFLVALSDNLLNYEIYDKRSVTKLVGVVRMKDRTNTSDITSLINNYLRKEGSNELRKSSDVRKELSNRVLRKTSSYEPDNF